MFALTVNLKKMLFFFSVIFHSHILWLNVKSKADVTFYLKLACFSSLYNVGCDAILFLKQKRKIYKEMKTFFKVILFSNVLYLPNLGYHYL
jgi:hypothetical protein